MPFTLLDLKVNDKGGVNGGMNFIHLTLLMLLHYLVKIETGKMQYYGRILPKEIFVKCIIASSKWTGSSCAVNVLITFCVSRRRRKMYCGHSRLCVCVCVSVCLSAAVRPHYCTDADVTWGMVEDAP